MNINKNQKDAFEKMVLQIKSRKTISFGIFETLVLLPFLYSTDLFFLMEGEFSKICRNSKSFSQLRIQAEKIARKNDEFHEPDINAIYSQLQSLTGISIEDSEKLKNLEADLIIKFCVPRKCGTELLREAERLNKKIILTDDTYLTDDIIEKILKKCNITGYRMIFLSNKTGLNKSGGDIYPHILKRLKIHSRDMFHIGSNLQADVESPINQGIMSLYLPSCREQLFKNGRLCGYIYKKLGNKINSGKYFSLRCLMGMYALYAFDYPSPDMRKGDFCESRENMGFAVLGGIYMYNNFSPQSNYEDMIVTAMRKNEDMLRGESDFIKIYTELFGNTLDKLEKKGCVMPLNLLVNHAEDTEKEFFKDILSQSDYNSWNESVIDNSDISLNSPEKKISENKKNIFSKLNKIRKRKR